MTKKKPGAVRGRPPLPDGEKKQPLSIRAKQDLLDFLREHGASEIIEEIICGTKRYKGWLAARKKTAKKPAKK